MLAPFPCNDRSQGKKIQNQYAKETVTYNQLRSCMTISYKTWRFWNNIQQACSKSQHRKTNILKVNGGGKPKA
jgi:hypothetical protein